MATQLPKNWYVCTSDELRVVRCSAAGVVLSDATIDPSLYDHHTAKLVADNLMGIMGHGGVPISLIVKSKDLKKEVDAYEQT